jgi:hypothetical protein
MSIGLLASEGAMRTKAFFTPITPRFWGSRDTFGSIDSTHRI